MGHATGCSGTCSIHSATLCGAQLLGAGRAQCARSRREAATGPPEGWPVQEQEEQEEQGDPEKDGCMFSF